MNSLIVIDFAGTLIKPEIIEEANQFRTQILERSLPTKMDHSQPESLYQVNRGFVEKLTGLNKKLMIKYLTNTQNEITLPAEKIQNQISTNLFQIGMYMAAKKHKRDIFPTGLISVLEKIKDKNYQLAIISGVRRDIISGMLQIAEIDKLFDYIKGQPPILGTSNEQQLIELERKGKIIAVIGDKLSDLEPAEKIKAKTVFVKWGHSSGGEEKFADYSIEKPEELNAIF